MENLISSWSNGKTVPESYVFPVGKRPGNEHLSSSSLSNNTTLPIIDLTNLGRDGLVHDIMDAAHHFGFFQVINHGVGEALMEEVKGVFKEFLELPKEERKRFCNGDFNSKCVLYTSNAEYHNEDHHFWRDAFKLSCTPLQDSIHYWPHKPARFRDVVREYVVNVTKLGSQILELLCQGLGLEEGYFDQKAISGEPILINYHYPSCPNPNLTFGISAHKDPNLITILLQDRVGGLQVLKDGQWIGVDPIPNAFVISIGQQLQIVTNGKLKSVDHRVITNKDKDRTSISFFVSPTMDCVVEPAKHFVTVENPPLYKPVRYQDFFNTFKTASRLKTYRVLENFMITP